MSCTTRLGTTWVHLHADFFQVKIQCSVSPCVTSKAEPPCAQKACSVPRSAPFYGRDLSVRGFGCPGGSGSWNQPQWLQRDNRTGDVGESRADLCLAWHPPLPRRRTAVTGVARAGVLGFVHGLLRSKRRRSRGRRRFGSEQTAPFSRRKVFSLRLDLLRRTARVAADCLTLRGAYLKLQNFREGWFINLRSEVANRSA